jgi:adenylate kinase family enzyme
MSQPKIILIGGAPGAGKTTLGSALAAVCSGWLVIDTAVLEACERNNEAWLKGSADPERMFRNFMGRSLWYNNLIRQQADLLQMNVLFQDGTKSVDDLCEMVLASSGLYAIEEQHDVD